ncbi:MAG: NAD-dependent epimerase/dehydratase family protein [Polyangiaceae bacterium]|nr:NAD-dependent epimerase/dehydratase family protein [Polyangiaceae bacterium]
MSICVITGSAGLIGSESALHFHELGYDVWGVDNDMRSVFFGKEASTAWRCAELESKLKRYKHHDIDIRDEGAMKSLFERGAGDIKLVIHTAAQPSHDWAAKEPMTDFTVNAQGTLVALEATRRFAPNAPFIFTSTNKVYGDTPNRLPLVELEKRWEIDESHEYAPGIPESMSIDASTHSLFGVSKAAADLLVQEYGRYFDMPTVCFRGGCLTGPSHSGTELHGFLAYLMKCASTGRPYTVFGYKGKQVRDNIHSADLVAAFECVAKNPLKAAVYNIGGGRESHCSMLEAIELCEQITGKKFNSTYSDESRVGDHIWWISNLDAFKKDYPDWKIKYDVPAILKEIYENGEERWKNAE